MVLSTEKPRAAIEDVFLFVIDDMELEIEPIAADADDKRIGEILVDRGDVKPGAVDAALADQRPVGELLVKAGNVTEDKLASALAEQQHLRTEAKRRPPPRRTTASACRPSGSTS